MAALAAPTSAPPALDVERLARVLGSLHDRLMLVEEESITVDNAALAGLIAAEYARLSGTEPE
ncbi:hypothetical protein D3C83_300880 [compost metagenome]